MGVGGGGRDGVGRRGVGGGGWGGGGAVLHPQYDHTEPVTDVGCMDLLSSHKSVCFSQEDEGWDVPCSAACTGSPQL